MHASTRPSSHPYSPRHETSDAEHTLTLGKHTSLYRSSSGSMGLASVTSTLFWGACTAFTLFWFATRIVTYFLMPEDWAVNDFAQTVLPDNADPSIKESFGKFIHAYYTSKQASMHMHIAVSVAMGVAFVFNLMPWVRRNYIQAHRVVGWFAMAASALFLPHMAYMLLVKGMEPVGRWFEINNFIGLATMVVCIPLGWYYARTKQIKKHKLCMNLSAAGLFMNPTERFFWVVFSKVLMYGGPWADWPSFRDTTTTATGIASVAACYGMALIYTIKAPPKPAAAPKVKAQ